MGNEVGVKRKWWTLVAVCVATFMLLIEARADVEADATSRNDDIAAGLPGR